MAAYLKFFALKKDPFDLRPGRGPVLATRPVRRALTWVREQLDDDRPILCVSGAPGIGRSSVARALPGSLAEHSHVARIVDPTLAWEDVARDVTEQLCFPDLTRASLLDARSLGRRVVVVVDAAEHASAEMLEQLDALLDLRGPARERLLQVVLLARPEARTAIGHPLWPWLAVRGAVVHEIDAISPDEIHGYIGRRLTAAGLSQDSLFSPSAAVIVHHHSQGVPRDVNQVCDAVLSEAVRRCRREIDDSFVTETMAGA